MQQLKSLQCEFCRMETFARNSDASVSGWIAEHYVALSRCFVHIMSHVYDIIKPQDEIVMHYYELMIQIVMCLIYHKMSPSNCDTTLLITTLSVFYKVCTILKNTAIYLNTRIHSCGLIVVIFITCKLARSN